MFAAASPGIPSFGDEAWKAPCDLVTLAALPASTYVAAAGTLTATANGALTVSATAVTVGQRVLVVGQATTAQNGIYRVTAAGGASAKWVLTRATDADTVAELPRGTTVYVRGDTGSDFDLVWMLTSAIGTFSDPQAWVMLRGPAISVYSNVQQSIPNNVFTDVVYQNLQYGPTGWWSSGLATITIPAVMTGIWNVSACFSLAAGGTGHRTILVQTSGGVGFGNRWPTPGAVTDYLATAGDLFIAGGSTIKAICVQNNGAALLTTFDTEATLSLHWVKG